TAERRNTRQRDAGEERIRRADIAPAVAVRYPPLLVARAEIIRRSSAHFLRLEDRHAGLRVLPDVCLDVETRESTAATFPARRSLVTPRCPPYGDLSVECR